MITEANIQTGKVIVRKETKKELTEIKKRVTDEALLEANKPYTEKRQSEYPSIGDQLDAIWKELKRQKSTGIVLESETDTMLLNIESVKTKYPKV